MRSFIAFIILAFAFTLVGCEKEEPKGATVQSFKEKRAALLKRKKKAGSASAAKEASTKAKKKAAKVAKANTGSAGSEAGSTAGATKAAADSSGDGTQVASAAPVPRSKGYGYNPEGKRDPFHSYLKVLKKKEEGIRRGPLERFELRQFRVSAIIWGENEALAMVHAPGGKGYIVRAGMKIGKNEGQIMRITDNTIMVRETYVNFEGVESTKDVEMRMRATRKGGSSDAGKTS